MTTVESSQHDNHRSRQTSAMASSTPNLASPTSDAPSPTIPGLPTQSSDGGGESKTLCPTACNGVSRNTSFPSLPTSTQPPSPHRHVSTVFTSNHRKTWQRSLSNYSQDTKRGAGDSQESHQLQDIPSADHSSPSSQSDAEQVRLHSKVTVYTEKPLAKAVTCARPSSGADYGVGDSQDESHGWRDPDSGDTRTVSCRMTMEDEDGGGVKEQSQTAEAGCSHPSCEVTPHPALTCRHPQEQPHGRHHTPCTCSSSPCNSQSSSYRTAGVERDTIELCVYQTGSSPRRQGSNTEAKDKRRSNSTAPTSDPSSSKSSKCGQSVSVLQTGNHSNPVSVSSHRKRKDSDHSTQQSENRAGRHRRRGPHRDPGGDSRGQQQGELPADCPPDTQPLLASPQARPDDRLQSVVPDLCLDNTLVRFHSLDGKDSSR